VLKRAIFDVMTVRTFEETRDLIQISFYSAQLHVTKLP
jgi:hypothetical protein